MSNIKKHLIFLYLILVFIFLGNVATKMVINPDNSVFKYVPLESDLVIEINMPNFIREVGFQKIYRSDYFEDEEVFDKFDYEYDTIKNNGIDLFSKVIIFRETWAHEPIWFMVAKIRDKEDFESFTKSYIDPSDIQYDGSYAVLQLNYTDKQKQEEISTHISNIVNKKVKSILSNPLIAEKFLVNNEVNIYLKTSKSDIITDGFLNVNFHADNIEILGNFSPVGNNTPVAPIQYAINDDKAFSLRSSLNLLQTLYLFNNSKLEEIPDYKQLSFDYDGATLLTVNEDIPIHTYPKINLRIESIVEETLMEYLKELENKQKIELKNDTIMINSATKTFIKYQLSEKTFSLYQDIEEFNENTDSSIFFNLTLTPSKLLDRTFFKKDEKNPPKMFANLKINVIQAILEDFQYLNRVQSVQFSIFRNDLNSDYISKGKVIYDSDGSHAMIESFILSKKLMEAFGSLPDIN